MSGRGLLLLLLLDSGVGDDLQTMGEMRWGKGWDEDDVDPLEDQEEAANSGNED